MNRLFVIIFFSATCLMSQAQDMHYTQKVIQDLCSDEFAGRGYIDDGVNKAADYLGKEFRKIGIKKFKRSYFQHFSFPINTFPTPIQCTLDNKLLSVGKDFLVAPNSGDCKGKYTLLHFDLANAVDSTLFEKKNAIALQANEAFVLKNAAKDNIPNNSFNIRTQNNKLIHSLSQTADDRCRLVFLDSIINNAESLSINAENRLIDRFTSKNIIGYVPATKKRNRNKFIVFTGHYDHLGKLGQASFPGASDNASGISMLLNLAKYYTQNKCSDYSIVFILFSGEEAGLLGSKYFVEHPVFNIRNIKALINLDIMGSAEDGITVVNATEFPSIYNRLVRINKKNNYLPAIKSRGKAANSDHYPFSELGIPSIFIYSNGGPGFYHDIYDKPSTLKLIHYNDIYNLLIKYVKTL